MAHSQAIEITDSSTSPFNLLSNLASIGFTLDGTAWPSIEHYFQCQRFTHNQSLYASIQSAATAAEARRIVFQSDRIERPEWETTKNEVMRLAVELKFTLQSEAGRMLIATGERELIAKDPPDAWWGMGPLGNGVNTLGKLLMHRRDELIREQELAHGITRDTSSLRSNATPSKHRGTKANDPLVMSEKRKKARARRNVFRHEDGSSMFELNSNGSATTGDKDTSVVVNVKALPTQAKLVAYQHQFRRRWEKNPDEFEEEFDEDDYDDDDDDDEGNEYIYHREYDVSEQPTLQVVQAATLNTPQHVNATEIIINAENLIELMNAINANTNTNTTDNDNTDETLDEMRTNLSSIQSALMQCTEREEILNDESQCARLFATIEAVERALL